MEKAELSRVIRGINTYSKAVDINFSELIRPAEEIEENPISIEDFFAYYDQFFYDISCARIYIENHNGKTKY